MGFTKPPSPVLLVIGVLAKNNSLLEKAKSHLTILYGNIETQLDPIPFTWTNYYKDEIGESPIRAFFSFEKLIPRENISSIKRCTNALEQIWSKEGLRPVNLDPGYLTLGQFFLATTKDQRQRVYLGNGIFVEPTLFFKEGEYHHFNWTYHDYRDPIYLNYFKLARSRLAFQLKMVTHIL